MSIGKLTMHALRHVQETRIRLIELSKQEIRVYSVEPCKQKHDNDYVQEMGVSPVEPSLVLVSHARYMSAICPCFVDV